jgi:hypothetical protein
VRAVDRVVLTASRWSTAPVLVLPADESWTGPPVEVVTTGGATARLSVAAGLAEVPESWTSSSCTTPRTPRAAGQSSRRS